MDRLKKPLSRRTVMVSTPTERRRPTKSVIHASAPAAVWALPGRQRMPMQSPVS